MINDTAGKNIKLLSILLTNHRWRPWACPVVCGMTVSTSADYPHPRASEWSDPRTVRVRKCTATTSPRIDRVHNCTVITGIQSPARYGYTKSRTQYTCKQAKSKCRVLCNIQSAKNMVSEMLYYAYIIQCLDWCDAAASVAIVVLIRGPSASVNGSSHRVCA